MQIQNYSCFLSTGTHLKTRFDAQFNAKVQKKKHLNVIC